MRCHSCSQTIGWEWRQDPIPVDTYIDLEVYEDILNDASED
jgi:hypothetical protein